jgi:hypothetical protein
MIVRVQQQNSKLALKRAQSVSAQPAAEHGDEAHLDADRQGYNSMHHIPQACTNVIKVWMLIASGWNKVLEWYYHLLLCRRLIGYTAMR